MEWVRFAQELPLQRSLSRGSFRFGRGLTGEGLADLEAGEAADDDVLAEFRDFRVEEIARA